MVFYGRPSRDCAPCRKRKTRCDLVPTGCSQCRRARVTCHGYRSSTELMFRDETQNTMQKVMASQRASRLPSAPQWSPDVSSRHAFLSLYIDAYHSYGHDTFQPLLRNSGHNSHLQVSVDAVSLGFMAFQLNRQDLVPLATQRYLAAIQSLGMVVRSSMQAANNGVSQSLSDATLQSVLFLDLYEKMAYQHHQVTESPPLLLSHVQAALSIVLSRFKGDFSNPTTQELANQSLAAFTLTCGSEGISIPEALVRPCNELSSCICSRDQCLHGNCIGLINLRADIRDGNVAQTDIVNRARELYDGLSHAERKMPRSWQPQRRHTCDAGVFDNYYDLYNGHFPTQVFNGYRIMRLEACDIIQKFAPSNEIAETITELTRAICATVPQFILPAARSQNMLPFSPLQILECCSVLTPLYAAAQITQDAEMRAWIVRTLMHMADNGVKSAQSVVHCIMSLPAVDSWTVFKIVGCYAVSAIK